MIEFPHDVIPCLPRSGYGVGRDPAVRSNPSYEGGSRNRLVNDAPSYQVNVTLDIDDAQYTAWQSFFTALNHGADWFLMDVDVGLGPQQHQVHLRSMYSADRDDRLRWKVSLPLEVRMINA